MPTIISKRTGEWLLDAAVEGADRAPFASRHSSMMQWWGKMNFLDQQSLKQMLALAPRGFEWLSSIPDSIAPVVYQHYPEVFDDTSGKSMIKFLSMESGRRFRIPGNRVVKL